MKAKHILSLLLLIGPFLMFSQSYTLSGLVKDTANNPVSYSNIVLLAVQDSTLVSGAISDEKGFFKLDNITPDKYVLKTSFLGYKTVLLPVDLSNDLTMDVVLSQDSEALQEVEITAQRPTLKRETDRLVFNIENTSLTEGNIWDILKNTPGVLMMNDKVLVKNSSNIIYLINGKRVRLSGYELEQLLSGSSAEAVQAIEVITNPSAAYDADGDAIINIKMSKNLIAGYRGSLYNNYTQGEYPRNLTGTSHFFKSKKISLYAGYSYDLKTINRVNEETVHFIENNASVGSWNSDLDRNTRSKSHNANLNFDYTINDKNTLSISGNTSIVPYWKRITQSFTQAVDSTFSSTNKTADRKVNIAATIDYVYKSKKGTELSFSAHHTNFDYERSQVVATDYRTPSNTLLRSNAFRTAADQVIQIYSAQSDLALPLKKNGTFSLGVKMSSINSKSNIAQLLTNNNSEVLDMDNSGLFKYKEDNLASYLNFKKTWNKWDLSLGLRTEYTQGDGRLESNTNQTNTYDYLEWFPSFNLTHTFNPNHSLGMGYNRRIERPTYANLNPFKFYLNDNSYVEGNPNLNPTITQIATLTYTIKDTYTFEAYYRIIDHAVAELTIQDNTNNQIKYLATNLKQNVDFGLDFSTYTSLSKRWNVYLINSIFKDKAEYFDDTNSLRSQTKWSMYTNCINYFSFLKDNSLTADVSLLYISPVIDGPAEVTSRAQVDFGLKKSFNKGKWTLSLRASDIFLTSDFTVKNQYGSQDNQYYAKFDNRWVQLGLRYKFGNTKLQTNQNTKELRERDRLENNH